MWAYWDHPHPRTPGCPLISSKGQTSPFPLKIQPLLYTTITLFCFYLTHVPVDMTEIEILPRRFSKRTFDSFTKNIPQPGLPTLSRAGLFSYFHQSKRSPIIASDALQANLSPLRYLWVCPPLQAPALPSPTLFHLNFNPIYGLSFPSPARGNQTIHPADFMSSDPVIKASVGICVQEKCMFASVVHLGDLCGSAW